MLIGTKTAQALSKPFRRLHALEWRQQAMCYGVVDDFLQRVTPNCCMMWALWLPMVFTDRFSVGEIGDGLVTDEQRKDSPPRSDSCLQSLARLRRHDVQRESWLWPP